MPSSRVVTNLIPRLQVPSFSATKNRGVVYIGHIPHGFYERQMRQFFGQFGAVTNLRLGRSKKTGKSRGFAFVEFKYMEVAKVKPKDTLKLSFISFSADCGGVHEQLSDV